MSSASGIPGSGPVLIFQNYYTPYRAALFAEIKRLGQDIVVLYAHSGEDEGRRWVDPRSGTFPSIEMRHWRFRKAVFFAVPQASLRQASRMVVLDNNPTNMAMIFWAFAMRLRGKPMHVWVEHIPDSFKGRLKSAYQKACSRMLLGLAGRALSFSALTDKYLDSIGYGKVRARMLQVTPRTSASESSGIRAGVVRSFGYLGSDQERKNVGELLSAFDSLNTDSLELRIAGFGHPQTDGRKTYCGYVDGDAREAFFQSVDVLVLPSLADPWGLVVNEALDRGCLCIVTRECGAAEMVDPRLVCGTSAGEIAACMRFVAGLSAEELRIMREQAANTMKRFTVTAAAEAFIRAMRG